MMSKSKEWSLVSDKTIILCKATKKRREDEQSSLYLSKYSAFLLMIRFLSGKFIFFFVHCFCFSCWLAHGHFSIQPHLDFYRLNHLLFAVLSFHSLLRCHFAKVHVDSVSNNAKEEKGSHKETLSSYLKKQKRHMTNGEKTNNNLYHQQEDTKIYGCTFATI